MPQELRHVLRWVQHVQLLGPRESRRGLYTQGLLAGAAGRTGLPAPRAHRLKRGRGESGRLHWAHRASCLFVPGLLLDTY